MNIVIPTIGSRGDVQPFIALAQGLIQAGHCVTLASHPVMKTLVEAHEVPFAPIGPDIDLAQRVAAIRQQALFIAWGLIQGMRFGFEMLDASHDDILAVCRQADLVIVPAAVAAGKNEAELLQVPYLSVTLMPWAIPWEDPARPLFRRIVYGAIDGLVHLITTQPLNRLRKRQGLQPVGEEGFTSPRLNLVPVSPAVYPPNPLWDPRHRIVGYWFAAAPQDWGPPADLLAFLAAGDPPLSISLGAMSLGSTDSLGGTDSLGEADALASASLFVEAVRQADVRAIIQGWQAGVSRLTIPPNIHCTGALPHSWLLPQCAGIVHHGGFGTTSAGLRAGLPALVIPHVVDQFYWGQRVYELGAGPQPIPRTRLEVKGLADALDQLVQDNTLLARASELGEQIRSETGVENAVRLIEETFSPAS